MISTSNDNERRRATLEKDHEETLKKYETLRKDHEETLKKYETLQKDHDDTLRKYETMRKHQEELQHTQSTLVLENTKLHREKEKLAQKLHKLELKDTKDTCTANMVRTLKKAIEDKHRSEETLRELAKTLAKREQDFADYRARANLRQNHDLSGSFSERASTPKSHTTSASESCGTSHAQKFGDCSSVSTIEEV